MKHVAAAMQVVVGHLGAIAKLLVGEYQIFLIYEKKLQAPIKRTYDESLRMISEPNESCAGYAGPEAFGLSIVENEKTLATCWVWYGERYRARNFWPLAEGEGKVIALETAPEARGRGLAPKLLDFACDALAERGFHRLYARIWHSNRASVRAFRKAGWKARALVIEIFPLGKQVRMVLGAKPTAMNNKPDRGSS